MNCKECGWPGGEWEIRQTGNKTELVYYVAEGVVYKLPINFCGGCGVKI